MILEQEKLDVTVKNRSNLFNWRGQFTPEFVEYILSSFAKTGDNILDPFSGSGTVLQESARLGFQATGFEINPSAHIMSNFFTFCNVTIEDRFEFCNKFEIKLYQYLISLNNQKVFIQNKDYKESYKNLLNFAFSFKNEIQNEKEKVFFMNILFQSEKDKKLTLKESILKSFQYTKQAFLSLPYTHHIISSNLLDARSCGDKIPNTIDLILTSPPYINVFNYHQNYRAIIEAFNFDVLKVAHSEFGSNRKNRGNRFKTVIQYCIDMELAIRSFWKALKLDGKMVLVVGRESNVRSTPFYNAQLVSEIIDRCEGFTEIKISERQFTNKFGINIKEDILIARKINNLSPMYNGREIAVSHLEESLKTSQSNVSSDIIDAIKTSEKVIASPIFNPQNVILK